MAQANYNSMSGGDLAREVDVRNDNDQIWRYDAARHSWHQAGQLGMGRRRPAVSVVKLQDIQTHFCPE